MRSLAESAQTVWPFATTAAKKSNSLTMDSVQSRSTRRVLVAVVGGYGGGRGYSSFRSTSYGEVFEFPFTTYPSYVNPNARCPVCGANVYFYQSPYGGRVFFDELGPPWPKHPCTDNPVVVQHFLSPECRARFLVGTPIQPSESDLDACAQGTSAPVIAQPRLVTWVEAGWMPFIVTRIVLRPIGIEAEGKLFVSAGGESVSSESFRQQQTLDTIARRDSFGLVVRSFKIQVRLLP